MDRPEQPTSGNQQLALNRHYRALGKRRHDHEQDECGSVIEVTEDNEIVLNRELPPQEGWSNHQSTSSNTSHNKGIRGNRGNRGNRGKHPSRAPAGPQQNPYRPYRDINHRNYMEQRLQETETWNRNYRKQNPNRPNIIYGQNPSNTPCMYDTFPQRCREKQCRFQHSVNH